MSVFREKRSDGSAFERYRGFVRTADGRRRKVVLYSDRKLSERKLRELQNQCDREAVDGAAVKREREGKRPIAEHIADYVSWLKLNCSSEDHSGISKGLLERLAAAAGWKLLRDITVESVESALPSLAPKTEAYRNSYIKRVKAFCAWLVNRGRISSHPLSALHRVSERRATRTRGRRAGSSADVLSLLSSSLPEHRLVAYGLACLNGLRRNEIKQLKWADIHLTATVPFVQLGRKMGKTDERDSLPLHPFVVRLLRSRMAMPGCSVINAVPDVKTLKADLKRVGVPFEDECKRRLDFHALRHTFCSLLDLTGASRATKKRLMRHASDDVTDGYAHADLGECMEALRRLPSPDQSNVQRALKTGTFDSPEFRTYLGQLGCTMVHLDAEPCTADSSLIAGEDVQNHSEKSGDFTTVQGCAEKNLNNAENGDILQISRPDARVD